LRRDDDKTEVYQEGFDWYCDFNHEILSIVKLEVWSTGVLLIYTVLKVFQTHAVGG